MQSIRFMRTGCLGKCPEYQVFLNPDNALGSYYVGGANVARLGTYRSTDPKAFKGALAALENHFLIWLPPTTILDAAHGVVIAQRCDVTTTLDFIFGLRPDLKSLFMDLDNIVDSIHWHKINNIRESPSFYLSPQPGHI